MPACTVHLLSLAASTTLQTFLQTISKSSLKPLTIAKIVRWIILPTNLSTAPLLAHNIHWDILLIIPSTEPLPPTLQSLIQHQWTVQAGIPGKLVQGYEQRNKWLLHPKDGDIPALTGSLDKPKMASSAQSFELSTELREWVEEFGKEEGSGAVSMLNLLAFKSGKKDEYLKYGAEFARSIGKKRGGIAKIVGSVIHEKGKKDDGEGWDEVALAHYPSVYHFADMMASDDYQEVNHRHRIGSLADTFIICTSELGIEEEMNGKRSKL